MLKFLKRFVRAFVLLPDIICSFLLICALFLVSKVCKLSIRARAPIKTTRKLLYLGGQTSLEAYEKINGFWAIYDQGLNGYFDYVYIGYFPTSKTQKVELKEGYTVYEMKSLLRGFFFLNYVLFLIKMVKVVFSEEITIIRAADPPYLIGPIGILLEKITGCPCVVSLHANYDLMYEVYGGGTILGSRRIAKFLEWFVFSHARMVLPISNHLKDYVSKYGVIGRKIRVIHHGIHLENFVKKPDPDFKLRLGVPSDSQIVLFVGRLASDKFPMDVVKAAAKVIDQYPTVFFFFYGNGPQLGDLIDTANKLGISRNVRFFGFQLSEKVAEALANIDISVIPLSAFVLIEAAAAGKPIVAYDIEWHSELIKDKETGLLIKHRDTTAMAEAIIYLLEHPDEAERYAKNARQLVIERYSFEAHCRTLNGIYEEAMAMKQR